MPPPPLENFDQFVARLRSGDRSEATIARVIELLDGIRDGAGRSPVAEAFRKNLFRSQEKLQRVLQTLEFHLDNSPVAVTEWGPDFRWIRWSAGAQRLFGYSAVEMLGRNFLDIPFIHPDDIPAVQAEMDRLLAGEIPRFTATNRNIRRDGSVVWCLWHNSVMHDEQGRIVSILSHAADVTDRVNAERELRHAREILEAHLNNSPMAIVEWGPDNRFLRWSSGAERMFGYSPGEMIGRRFDNLDPPLIHPDDIPLAMEHVRVLVSGRESRSTVTARNHRKDGSVRWINWISSSLYDASGKLVSVLSHGIDVTERVLGEQLISESEQRFRAAFELGSVGMAVSDARTLRFLNVNQEFCRITGYSERELAEMTPVDLIHPDDRAAGAENRQRLARGEPLRFSAERRIIRKNGQVVWVQFTVNTLLDAAGRPERVLGAVFDITDRVRAEQQLRAAKERVEAASRAKDRFIATLSHELRTPLTPVRALLSALSEDARLPADTREELKLVLPSVQAECRLIDDLLDMTRVSRGQIEMHMAPCDAHEILRSALHTASAEARERSIRLVERLDAPVSSVKCDAQRLGQVFWNLLGNALKFTPPGGTVEVVTDNPSRDQWRLRVIDTGVGIAPEHLPYVLEPFERGETRHRYEYTGLGLGLSIARALLELMHGSIEAHSDGPGKGATFVVTLPVCREPVSPQEPALPARPSAPAGARPTQSVLLVEDHAPTAEILSRLLRRGGRRVVVAATAADARQRASDEKFDLLLCDIGLPDESGHDLLRALRRAGVTAPALALSGYGMDSDIAASRAAGFAEHLVKPIDFAALEAALDRALGASA